MDQEQHEEDNSKKNGLFFSSLPSSQWLKIEGNLNPPKKKRLEMSRRDFGPPPVLRTIFHVAFGVFYSRLSHVNKAN